jgi:IS5 family transposase
VHESQVADTMLEGAEGDAVIADKAYDSNAIRDRVKAARMKVVIPSSRSRKKINLTLSQGRAARGRAPQCLTVLFRHLRGLRILPECHLSP